LNQGKKIETKVTSSPAVSSPEYWAESAPNELGQSKLQWPLLSNVEEVVTLGKGWQQITKGGDAWLGGVTHGDVASSSDMHCQIEVKGRK